ncbi:hypothetical protein DPMN_030694 [Dreissena polymorpha]|uniref:Uncharacterized protein n=1 Tax=Dreissena polymorpha TaxID=45954 RepID=A0A9D4LYL9_DREPO|nr:hypothetical protein DPMN_030694 [Dreissena polymorpha]
MRLPVDYVTVLRALHVQRPEVYTTTSIKTTPVESVVDIYPVLYGCGAVVFPRTLRVCMRRELSCTAVCIHRRCRQVCHLHPEFLSPANPAT